MFPSVRAADSVRSIGLGEERRRATTELTTQAERTKPRGGALRGVFQRAVDLLPTGDAHAHQWLTEARDLLAREDRQEIRYAVGAIEAMLEIRVGRLTRSERLAQECARLGAEFGYGPLVTLRASQLIAIRWYQGRLDELVPAMRSIAVASPFDAALPSHRSALAAGLAVAGEPEEALRKLTELCGAAETVKSSGTSSC